MKYFEKLSKLNIKNISSVDLQRQMKNPSLLDSPSQKEMKNELKRRQKIIGSYSEKFPNLNITFDWSK